MESAISAQDLEIGYTTGKDRVIVSRIPSLELRKGKLTCLLGANGIGKSTLLKTITGNLAPLAGEVRIEGQPITELPIRDKAKKLAVVLTDKAHLGFTTVLEMITLGRNPYTNWMNTLQNKDSAAIERALEAIGMLNQADKPLAELSDGNLQKVVIGRAIAQETAIIILDEPTIHLDISNKTIIVELLRKLCQEHGKTILFSTHDLELAKLFADDLWIMEEDQLVHGLTEDIILQGLIEKSFNYKISRFEELHEYIDIQGPEELSKLTRRALAKAKLRPQAPVGIRITREENSVLFALDEQSFHSLDELITYLEPTNRIR